MRSPLGPLARFRPRGPAVVAAIGLVLLFGLGLGQALRDTTPPSLWTEAPTRVAVGQRFELFLSADEPVRYRVGYGDATITAIAQDFTVQLSGLSGQRSIEIEAVDGAGNASARSLPIEGVVVPEAAMAVSHELRPGVAFSVTIHFEPVDAPTDIAGLTLDGAPLTVHAEGERRYAIAAVPLVLGPGTLRLELTWVDGLGSERTVVEPVDFAALGGEVEELRIDAATLAVVTPEGRELEASALAAAKADARQPPRWTEPFLMPVPGHGTSAFASARRYAPGGRVSFHQGEDLAAPVGTPIRATNAGVVLLSGDFPIKGGLTVIDHGAGVTSRYYHQSRTFVTTGQAVERGEVIGEVGSTGLSTGPHLHWEMRVGEQPTDPVGWVGRSLP